MGDAVEQKPDEPFFFGTFEHALDSQCRVAIPGEWRKSGGDGAFVLFPARGSALILLPAAIFREFIAGARKLAVADPKIQMAFALIGAKARQCRCDKQGRIAFERPMLEGIGVKNQLKLIGALNHIRLCAPENWQEPSMETMEAQLDEMQKLGGGAGDVASLLASLLGGGRG